MNELIYKKLRIIDVVKTRIIDSFDDFMYYFPDIAWMEYVHWPANAPQTRTNLWFGSALGPGWFRIGKEVEGDGLYLRADHPLGSQSHRVFWLDGGIRDHHPTPWEHRACVLLCDYA